MEKLSTKSTLYRHKIIAFYMYLYQKNLKFKSDDACKILLKTNKRAVSIKDHLGGIFVLRTIGVWTCLLETP